MEFVLNPSIRIHEIANCWFEEVRARVSITKSVILMPAQRAKLYLGVFGLMHAITSIQLYDLQGKVVQSFGYKGENSIFCQTA